MAVRPPTFLGGPGDVVDPLGAEIMAEKAATLGRAGEKVEKMISLLEAHQGDETSRKLLLSRTADAVFAYFVQRELCGFRRHDGVIREYRIPREVLIRLGAR